MEKESVLPGLVLPMVSNIHDMTGCIRQALALFDRGTAFPLRLVSVDIVRAFHFHLHCIQGRCQALSGIQNLKSGMLQEKMD